MPFRSSAFAVSLAVALLLVLGRDAAARPGPAPGADEGSPTTMLCLVDISGLGRAELDTLAASDGLDLWLELGDTLVTIGSPDLRDALDRSRVPYRLVDDAFDARRYRIVASRDPDALKRAEGLFVTVAGAGGFRLVRPIDGREADLRALESFRFRVEELPSESVVLHGRLRGPAGAESVAAPDPDIQNVVDAFDQAYLIGRTQALIGAGSRNSLAANFVNVTNHVAADHGGLGLAPQLDPFVVQTRSVSNVISEIPGLLHPDDIYILCGHYDAVQDYPGADDNASGTATTLAIAKVFTQRAPLSTIRFVNFAAEEQGLIGSDHYVSDLLALKDHDRIRAVINMDMIAYENRTDGRIDVLLEGRSRLSQPLMDDLAASARDYTTLQTPSVSYNPFGSDHMPFINKNIPTLLTIENEDGANPYYHSAGDTYATLNPTLHREISKMNLATLAKLAGTRDLDDAIAPGAVTGPAITGLTHSAITLGFTASGDDAAAGKAAAFDVRYAAAAILDEAAFASAVQAEREPKPAAAGTAQAFTLMGLAAGTRYCLSVRAVDDNLNVSALPADALCATTDPVALQFSDDAEAGTTRWTADAAWHRDPYRNRTPGGTYSWKAGGIGSAYYANSLNASLVSPYVALGPGSALQFWHRMLAKETNDTDSPDGGIVEIQPIGSTSWTQIAPVGGYNYAHVGGPFPAGTRLFAGNIPWKEERFDLAAYSGQVRFRFRFGSNASTAWEGWYIDDVAVVSQVLPSEVSNGGDGEPPLLIGKSGSDLSFSWGPVAGADFYNVYRGSLASLVTGAYDHACLQGNVTGRQTAQPAAAGDYYFLVSAQNHAGEGPGGRDGAGSVIPIAEAGRCAP